MVQPSEPCGSHNKAKPESCERFSRSPSALVRLSSARAATRSRWSTLEKSEDWPYQPLEQFAIGANPREDPDAEENPKERLGKIFGRMIVRDAAVLLTSGHTA